MSLLRPWRTPTPNKFLRFSTIFGYFTILDGKMNYTLFHTRMAQTH